MDMTNQNGYLVPKMAMKETHRPPVGRIGLQREKFLQENHSPAVRQDAAGRDAVQRPETDRAALLGAGGADHHEAAGQQPGTGQEQRPVGLDRAHEQSASAGGGTGDAHRDEPVNTEPTTAESEPSPSAVSVSDEIELPESVGRGDLAEETAAAIGVPAPEQQQETIRLLQPRASWQPPIRMTAPISTSRTLSMFLSWAAVFVRGVFAYRNFFSATVLPTVKEQADWLKKRIRYRRAHLGFPRWRKRVSGL